MSGGEGVVRFVTVGGGRGVQAKVSYVERADRQGGAGNVEWSAVDAGSVATESRAWYALVDGTGQVSVDGEGLVSLGGVWFRLTEEFFGATAQYEIKVFSTETILVRFDAPNEWHALFMFDPTVTEQGSDEIIDDGRYRRQLEPQGVFGTSPKVKVNINNLQIRFPKTFLESVKDGGIPAAIFVERNGAVRLYDFHGHTSQLPEPRAVNGDLPAATKSRRFHQVQVSVPAKPLNVPSGWRWRFRTEAVLTRESTARRTGWNVVWLPPAGHTGKRIEPIEQSLDRPGRRSGDRTRRAVWQAPLPALWDWPILPGCGVGPRRRPWIGMSAKRRPRLVATMRSCR